MSFRKFLEESVRKKSEAASFVLKMMDKDEDADYGKALSAALKKFPKVKKSDLEAELDNYI